MSDRIAIIQSELKTDPAGIGYAAMRDDYPAIARAMNERPLIDNPDEQGQVQRQIERGEIVRAITADEARALYQLPGLLDDLAAAFSQRDVPLILAYLEIAGTGLTQGSKNKLRGLLQETEADPKWKDRIRGDSRAQILGLAQVKPFEVQEAMNR